MAKRSKSEHINVTLKQPAKAWQFNEASGDWFVSQLELAGCQVIHDALVLFVDGIPIFEGDYVVLFADGCSEPFTEEEFIARFNSSSFGSFNL